jgi:hypothetical protein
MIAPQAALSLAEMVRHREQHAESDHGAPMKCEEEGKWGKKKCR